MTPTQEMIDAAAALTKAAADQGKLIEAGWIGLRALALPPDAPAIQLEEMRNAFFAGAHHVFASIMSMLEDGDEPTENDENRMTLIHSELDEFIANFTFRRLPPEGST